MEDFFDFDKWSELLSDETKREYFNNTDDIALFADYDGSVNQLTMKSQDSESNPSVEAILALKREETPGIERN